MRKILMGILLISTTSVAQDTLRTSVLDEVVVTGTRFELPVEKSGKTIYRFDREQLEENAGKSLADLLNEVPGIQSEGNFGTPGSNQSYFVRGGRNRQTLILIDGVPLNDPSSISAEYDLRYIPLSQIESVEILKGGLSTLYGTSASAGVINITLRSAGDKPVSGQINVEAGSWKTFSQNAVVNGAGEKLTWFVSANNLKSEGFSSAENTDPAVEFDKDGIDRQNVLLKSAYRFDPNFEIEWYGAYETFEAGYDDYEFTDAPNHQTYNQWRVGMKPRFSYTDGNIEGRFVFNRSERIFSSSFPEHDLGGNFQGELVHRHIFSEKIQTVAGLNYQRMSMEQKGQISPDSATFWLFDPYASVFVDLPAGLNFHAGIRLNTHSHYGNEFIYNMNPSWLLNGDGTWRYKIFAAVSTSYITPSLYQLYSFAGNTALNPERAFNLEGGVSVYRDGFTLNAVVFSREDSNPIDFISQFDEEGNYIGGRYQNVTAIRSVHGVESDIAFRVSDNCWLSGHFTWMDTDTPDSFYKIPKVKYGAALRYNPVDVITLSLKYNYTGDRTTFDFASFSEVELDSYQLIDLYADWSFRKNFTLYTAINNLFDEEFVALYGYTTRGRNLSAGLRFKF